MRLFNIYRWGRLVAHAIEWDDKHGCTVDYPADGGLQDYMSMDEFIRYHPGLRITETPVKLSDEVEHYHPNTKEES